MLFAQVPEMHLCNPRRANRISLDSRSSGGAKIVRLARNRALTSLKPTTLPGCTRSVKDQLSPINYRLISAFPAALQIHYRSGWVHCFFAPRNPRPLVGCGSPEHLPVIKLSSLKTYPVVGSSFCVECDYFQTIISSFHPNSTS